MAKNTKEGALQTELLVYQTIVDIFMENGWDAVTYGSIAKRTGLSRSGIQRIVPTKESMITAFQGQLFAYVTNKIDASSDESIRQSWRNALLEAQFANCIRYLIGAISSDEEGRYKAAMGFQKLCSLYGEKLVIELIGTSVAYLLGAKLKDIE
ncbi:TetR/AcrR family transcriptional regulator [Enterovibrio nigricans]|uniref:Transcriptional regulator, TetR family n=1 Tax=Enterovibrio nigricans DSM 22720 TaxID=1121868 RepID=A0A1T4VI82_9GAMM|nr:TetR/AcrR family transcriptional regulator [Enterovibrio nigricans]PKF49740.1 TetR/AcrR family transcriptional regulator [Enterovibrio nigricans]SKA64639.1 transcriptional regulator, TetR family [Enterovibrio nigricans DSM 22720]